MRIRAGDVMLDTETRAVQVAGKRLRLTSKEYRLLELLSLHNDCPLSRAAILDDLYGADVDRPELKIIDVFVAMLQKKLADASGRPGHQHIAVAGERVRLIDASAGDG